MIRPRQIYGSEFRKLVDPFKVDLPETGLVLVRGVNKDTGDSSDSGKSSLLQIIPYMVGGCPYPSTELVNWHTGKAPHVGVVLDTPRGEMTVERAKGLSVKLGGETWAGEAAKAELDRTFGMDVKLRALTTYRSQGAGGLFLGMPDADKKEFLTKVLGLDRYERLAADAGAAAKGFRDKVQALESTAAALRSLVDEKAQDLPEAPDIGPAVETLASLKEAAARAKKTLEDAEALQQQAEVRAGQQVSDAVVLVEAELEARLAVLRHERQAALEIAPALSERGQKAAELLPRVVEALKTCKEEDLKKKEELAALRRNLQEAVKLAQAEARPRSRLQQDLERLQHDEAHLAGQTCPTCQREWVTDEAQLTLEQVRERIAQLRDSLKEAAAAEARAQKEEAELKALPGFVPSPKISQLEARQDELEQIVKAEKTEAEAEKMALLRDIQKRETEATQAASEGRRQAQGLAPPLLQEVRIGVQTARQGRERAEEELRRQTSEVASLKQAAAVAASKAQDLAQTRSRLEAAESELEAQRAKLALELDVVAAVGKEGFLGVIFDNILGEVSDATNAILESVANVRHLTFEFDLEKETASGNVQRRIIPVVYSHGRKVPFNSGLSGGMQSMVNLAVDLGFGEVASNRRNGYPGWLELDEAFDGLGNVAKESCMEMLSNHASGRLVLVVDHNTSFQGLFHQIISLECVDGRSRVV